MTFIDRDGTPCEVKAVIGESMLEVAHSNNIDLEGACEGSLACSTCHVIVEGDMFDLLPEADDDENDMLDLAFGLTEKCVSSFHQTTHIMVKHITYLPPSTGAKYLRNSASEGV